MTNAKRNKMQGKESDKKDLKLSVLLALCILFALMAAGLMGCNKETPKVVYKPVLSLSIDMLLPTDSNGYSYYELYNPNGQNIHTISGKLLIDGKPPVVGEPVIVPFLLLPLISVIVAPLPLYDDVLNVL